MGKAELKVIGETLRERREERKMSLKEAAHATSIQISHLAAIENGEMENLPPPIYAQGFFKQYAAYLGVDGEQLLRDNPDLFNKPGEQEFTYGIGTLEMRGHPGATVKWLPNAAWIVAFGVLFALAWFAARYLDVI